MQLSQYLSYLFLTVSIVMFDFSFGSGFVAVVIVAVIPTSYRTRSSSPTKRWTTDYIFIVYYICNLNYVFSNSF